MNDDAANEKYVVTGVICR